jgi:hypothetical protein
MPDESETSESGQPILRHGAANKPFTPVSGSESAEAIDRHMTSCIGKPAYVYHEIASHLVHVDVHVIPPSAPFNFYTLVTSGMSDLPMKLSPQAFAANITPYAEVMMCLPPDWPFPTEPYHTTPQENDGENHWYWPVRWLRFMARFPHEHDTWFGFGHTMPNGDPPQPLAPDTKLCAMLLLPSLSVPKAMWDLDDNGKRITFFALWPIYAEELELKLKEGTDPLIKKFEQFQITDLVKLDRPNACAPKRRLWPF